MRKLQTFELVPQGGLIKCLLVVTGSAPQILIHYYLNIQEQR